ncbi:MAG: hypothetical protein KGL39_48040 [Patescibacteria group bacterium]|nr:hypothetical protein [Patescibacteria group bacterium]
MKRIYSSLPTEAEMAEGRGMLPQRMHDNTLDFWDHLAAHGTMLFSDRKPTRDELVKALRALVQDAKYQRSVIALMACQASEADEIIDMLWGEVAELKRCRVTTSTTD